MVSPNRSHDIISRLDSSPVMEEKEFDRLLTNTVRALLRQYHLQYDHTQTIVTSDDLADRFFQAGLETAVICGIYCTDTHQRIRFSQEEILQALQSAPNHLVFGQGAQERTLQTRKPEDPRPPLTAGGSFGAPIPPEYFSAVMESYAKEPLLDTLAGCTLIMAQTPEEIRQAQQETAWSSAAATRAGRPGLSIGVAEDGLMADQPAAPETLWQSGWRRTHLVSELKTTRSLLCSAAQMAANGTSIHACCSATPVGRTSGAESIAVCQIAGTLLACTAHLAATCSTNPVHPLYHCNTTPELIWAISAAQQALNRNTHLLSCCLSVPVSGPMTASLLYECAALATAASVSGAARVDGVCSAAGNAPLHVSGLEARFQAEIAHAAAGLSRSDADQMIRQFEQGYTDILDRQPIGKSFLECYDLAAIRPTEQWQALYQNVKEEIFRIGLPIQL